MKILYRTIVHNARQSFSHNEDIPFNLPFHCHEEYELIYIVSGKGKEYIGDSMNEYQAGDLMLIGSNTPHLHLCDPTTGKNDKGQRCDILYFPESIFPANMEHIEEYATIHSLLKENTYGIKFQSKETIEKVHRAMKSLNNKKGIERIISLYKILDILSTSEKKVNISSLDFQIPTNHYSLNDPVSHIYTYLKSNFRNTISLKSIANYTKQNTNSLCRLFKSKTGKTIFYVLNEIRIEYACRLLRHSNLTTAQIAYEVGFNNLSHFNKTFKSFMHQTPTEYKNALQTNF